MPEMSNAAAERAAAQKAVKDGSLKERETYTAKQVAIRCGTDAKTMRKFFRSPHSTVEPVGQGGRYEFDAADMPKIKREFTAWQKRAAERRTKPANGTPTKKNDIPLSRVADAIERSQGVEETDEDFNIPTELNEGPLPKEYETDSPWEPHPDLEDADPTEDELAEVADLELDLDDLDAEED